MAVTALTLALLCISVRAIATEAAGDRSGEVRVGNVTRTFLVHVPDRAPPRGGFPVVLAFHGGGGQGAKMVKLMGLNPFADERGFIVVYPDGLDRHWNDGRSTIKNKNDDIGFVSALLDKIEKRFPVNTAKVFAVGVSNGAVFAERLGCELSGRIAAIAAVSGTMAAELAGSCRPVRPISALQISGTADPIMPFAGGKVTTMLGSGEGGTVLSAEGTAALWARLDGCAQPAPPERQPETGKSDGTWVERLSYEHCRGAATVTLLAVHGGGHAWPGGRQFLRLLFGKTSNQLNASKAVVDFFFPK